MEPIEITAGPQAAGRLDAWLAGQCEGVSRSALQGLMEQNLVTRDGQTVNKKDKVCPGSVYQVQLPDPQPIEAVPQDIPLSIVYEDADLVVVNKPKGMVVHPAPGNPDGTLVNALLYHCAGQLSGIGGAIRPGIVHRIDKDTSGLLVVAKNDAAHQALSSQLSVHGIHRVYHAIVYGNLKEDEGFVETWLGRDPGTGRRWQWCLKMPPEQGMLTQAGGFWRDSATSPILPANSKQGAPIRSVYIWRPSGIPLRGMQCTDRAIASRVCRDSVCTPKSWALSIRLQENGFNLIRRFHLILRIF